MGSNPSPSAYYDAISEHYAADETKTLKIWTWKHNSNNRQS